MINLFFDINNSTYLQNRNNFYVGNINTDENIKFKCDYLVIGNIRTNSMLIAMGNLIVIGNIEASSVFINNDLFCTGNIITESYGIYTLVFWLVTLLIFLWGNSVFKRSKKEFSDVL